MTEPAAGSAVPAPAPPLSGSPITRFDRCAGYRVAIVEPAGGSAAATLLMVHGLGDHMGRHLRTARDLARHGYRCVLSDLAAHGADPHDWNEVAWVHECYATLDDPQALADAFRADTRWQARRHVWAGAQQHRLRQTVFELHLTQVHALAANLRSLAGIAAGDPWFLFGHSMGGLLVTETTWRLAPAARQSLAGVVLVAPALEPQGNPDDPLMRAAMKGLWALRQSPMSAARTAAKAALALDFTVDTTWGDKWLSDVRAEVRLFQTDPLIPHAMSTRYASTIETQMDLTAARGPAFPADGLVIVPRVDGITSREAGVRFARRVTASGGAMRLRELDIVAHDVLRSSARDQAQNEVRGFLADQLAQKDPRRVH